MRRTKAVKKIAKKVGKARAKVKSAVRRKVTKPKVVTETNAGDAPTFDEVTFV